MAKLRVTCPECETAFAISEGEAEGPKVRCTHCEAVFPTPGRARMAGQRRFKAKKKSSNSGTVVAIVAVLALLTAGVAAGGYAWMKSKSRDRGTMATRARTADVVPAAGIGINVGQLAQEISGEDIDGVAFKLSDYRGKVVLLDFWGHW